MSSTAGVATRTRFIARQPIFDRARNVQAYELLFRQNSEENAFRGSNLDMASQSVMDTAVLLGANALSNGHSIYLNCTRKSLLDGHVTLFPPATTVVEVLENVEPEPDVIEACRDLKKAGYRIALDDFVDDPRFAPLVNLADIIKVDFRLAPPHVWADMARRYAPKGIQLLAEKVETHDEFSQALQLGYKLFQGYFFCKPRMLSTRDISSSRATYLRILQVVHAPEMDYFKIEALIKSEPALFYRFFRYLNSAATPVRSEVKSILQAVTLLGEEDIRKWLTLVCAVLANEGQPSELIVLALVRARFSELLADRIGLPGCAAFMLGLFSLMEAILEIPIRSVLEQINLPQEVAAALLGDDSPLARLEELVLAVEKGEWELCDKKAREFHIPDEAVTQAHIAAVEWVQTLHLG